MERSNAQRAPLGFAAQTLVFILATIGITATATVAIVQAYQKWVVEPRTPSELKRLSEENSTLKSKVKQLEGVINQSGDEQVLEAARVLRLTWNEAQSEKNPYGVAEEMKRRDLTSEEIQLLDLEEAGLLVQKALKQGQTPLDSVFGSSRMEALRGNLPIYQSNVAKRVDTYKSTHTSRRSIIETRIEDATHPKGAEEGR